MATKKYKCKVCGYIHEGDSAPAICPVCQAPSSEFELLKEKKGINKESSLYIFIYTAIIIVIVSLLLSFTSELLKSRQAVNIELDKKKQILSSLRLDMQGQDIAELYKNHIEQYVILNQQGEIAKDVSDDFNYEIQKEEFPLYIASIEGETKYIIPLNGAGLWGAIWGYVALNEDKNTIYGIYFSHASETPGLGANIVEEAFQSQFNGKHIMDSNNDFVSIAVMKTGQIAKGQEQVDAISGGTITSKGVEDMLKHSIGNYSAFLSKQQTSEEITTNNTEEIYNENE